LPLPTELRERSSYAHTTVCLQLLIIQHVIKR
jgi:hypothetical protein